MGQIKNIKLHIVTDIKTPVLTQNQQNGRRGRRSTNGIEEEENVQEVHVPWSGLGSAPRPLQRATDGNRACPGTSPIHSWSEDETSCIDEETEKGEERSSGEREAGRRENTSPQHDRVAGHDRFDYRHPQREDVQPSGNQTRDDRTLSRRVLVDVQTRETWKAWYWSHTFLAIHPAEVNNNNNNDNNKNNNNRTDVCIGVEYNVAVSLLWWK